MCGGYISYEGFLLLLLLGFVLFFLSFFFLTNNVTMIRKQILYLMDGLIFQENAERHPREKGLLTIKHIFSIFICFLLLFIYVCAFA